MKKIFLLCASLFALTSLLFSCESSDAEGDNLPTGEAILSVDKSRIFNTGADEATFTVMCEEIDVTQYATIYQVGAGAAMTENTFAATENGVYEFYANYKNSNTNSVSLTVGSAVADCPADPQESSTDFKNRMLMMQFTGLDCTYCQYMIPAVDALLASEELGDKVEHVSVHAYYGYGSDPLYSSAAANLAQAMGVSYYPSVIFDMDETIYTYNNGYAWAANYDKLELLISNNYQELSPVGICAVNSIEGVTLTANVEVKAAEEGTYSVGMLLLENGVMGSQSGLGNIEHINAFRDSATRSSTYNFAGSSVGTVALGERASTIIDMTLSDEWDLDNCHLLIYVTALNESGDYIVQNVVRCEIEDEVEYQYID